jgi:enoyl-CoA hydratase/carnithine racemase
VENLAEEVLTVTLNRPERKNAIKRYMITLLNGILARRCRRRQ